jgi:hypothetical protein
MGLLRNRSQAQKTRLVETAGFYQVVVKIWASTISKG